MHRGAADQDRFRLLGDVARSEVRPELIIFLDAMLTSLALPLLSSPSLFPSASPRLERGCSI
eukprot:8837794-Pyramimonas_sp.AAC.1